jgi:hypothetical protein
MNHFKSYLTRPAKLTPSLRLIRSFGDKVDFSRSYNGTKSPYRDHHRILEMPQSYIDFFRLQRVKSVLSYVVPTGLTFFFFVIEWYPLAVLTPFLIYKMYWKHKTHPVLQTLITSIDVNEKDKNKVILRLSNGKTRITTVDRITPNTDIYAAAANLFQYRDKIVAEEEAINNAGQENKGDGESLINKVAGFSADKESRVFAKGSGSFTLTPPGSFLNIQEDLMSNMQEAMAGKVISHKPYPDRFTFFLRNGPELLHLGFPLTPETTIDCKELLRVVNGGRDLVKKRQAIIDDQGGVHKVLINKTPELESGKAETKELGDCSESKVRQQEQTSRS